MNEKIKQIPKSIMITGASSTGKTTLVRALVDTTEIKRIPGDTTRPPREGEIEGFDYRYLSSVDEFMDNFFVKKLYIDPNLAVTHYNSQYYGSPRTWISSTGIRLKPIIFTPTSTVTAQQIKDTCGEHVFWVHLFTTDESRERRLLARAITPEEIAYRLSQGDSQGLNANADTNIDTTNFNVNDVSLILFQLLADEQ